MLTVWSLLSKLKQLSSFLGYSSYLKPSPSPSERIQFDGDIVNRQIRGSHLIFWWRPASGSQASLNFCRIDDKTAVFALHDALSSKFLEALAHFRSRGLHQVRDVLTS
jgi:hypothetical protein